MQKFTKITGKAAPLIKANINTDIIIPAKRLVGFRREELGAFAFEAWRYRGDGAEDPNFVLNTSRYRGASILVTGENFGCGSSRESAVWALAGIGIRCILAPSFGDIFDNNAFQNGLLLVSLPQAEIDALGAALDAAADPTAAVDLVRQTIALPDSRLISFTIDAERREALLEGYDEIGMTLARDAEIAAYQKQDRAARPWIYQTTSNIAGS
jgi:3-isopropylmalate/(R)-2-methylmalate dehydratase small subunit